VRSVKEEGKSKKVTKMKMSTGDVAQGPWSSRRRFAVPVPTTAAATTTTHDQSQQQQERETWDEERSSGDISRSRSRTIAIREDQTSDHHYTYGYNNNIDNNNRNNEENQQNHRVSRSLFGETNHEENARTFRQEMDTCYHRHRNKWNFDFVNEAPIEGRYEWEKVHNTSNNNNNFNDKQLNFNHHNRYGDQTGDDSKQESDCCWKRDDSNKRNFTTNASDERTNYKGYVRIRSGSISTISSNRFDASKLTRRASS